MGRLHFQSLCKELKKSFDLLICGSNKCILLKTKKAFIKILKIFIPFVLVEVRRGVVVGCVVVWCVVVVVGRAVEKSEMLGSNRNQNDWKRNSYIDKNWTQNW